MFPQKLCIIYSVIVVWFKKSFLIEKLVYIAVPRIGYVHQTEGPNVSLKDP